MTDNTPPQSESLTIEQALEQAISHHQAGRLPDAEHLYRAILQVQPDHPDANHNLGIVAVQVNQPAAGLPHLKAAVVADPKQNRYWVSYVDALFQADRLETARETLALAKQHGAQSDQLEALAARLENVASTISPSTKKKTKSKATKQNKSASHLKKSPSPQDVNALVSAFNAERYPEAVTLARTMTLRYPLHGLGWMVLGAAFKQMGQTEEALMPMQKAAALAPGDVDAHNNLGVTLQTLGRLGEAEASCRRALQIKPDYATAHNNLGNILQDLNRLDEAEACYRRALALKPDYAKAHNNLGDALSKLNRLGEAEASYRLALQFNPDYAETYNSLGNVLRDLGRLDEAEASCRQALQINPDYAEAYNNLGGILHAQDRLNEAEASYRRTLAIKPDFAETHYNLSNALKDQARLVEAEASCRRALDIAPEHAPAHQNLAVLLAYLSDFDQVVTESDTALRLMPDDAVGWEHRLYTFSYHPDLSVQAIYDEFVRWGARFPKPSTDFSAHDRSAGRRLRVGYVSPDFRRHSSRFFFWPLFANHDVEVVELYAYSNVGVEDDITQEFKGLFNHWRNIRGVSDSDAARVIREDQIDILVDCCNHTRDCRLEVFALKPAPIQVTWLGTAWTTGLKMIDYVLLDPYMAPERTLTSETIVRLPHSFMAYRPPETTAELALPPCLSNGYITFGYTGRTEKLNHHTFRVWGEILKQLPSARLIFDFGPFADPPTQAYYRRFMQHYGINSEQVTLRKSANIFAGLNDIDILLDCFPHNGGTTLLDALWMGVPILTLAGRPPVGRIGASLMNNLGLLEWVADSHAQYISQACCLAQNVQNLTQLRAGMRQRLQDSPIMDGLGFARAVESAYRDMFDKWAREGA